MCIISLTSSLLVCLSLASVDQQGCFLVAATAMPAKKLSQPKQVREKLPETAVGKLRQTRSEPEGTADGKHLASLIPVVRKRGRPSLIAKFDPTVDINDALKRLGKGFFTGEEKDLFKTPLKVRPTEKQRQSTAGLGSSPLRSNKRGVGRSGSSSQGSPGSKVSSPDSPYFLRSKGAADEDIDDSLLQPRRRQKTVGLDFAEKASPAKKTKPVGLGSAEKATPAKNTKAVGLDSVEKATPAKKGKSVGLASAEKESPVRKGRKSMQSPPIKKAEASKPKALIKAARASLSGRKDDDRKNSILDKVRVGRMKKDAARSRRQTKTSQDPTSEESANEAKKSVRVETGKKRKREEDESDDPKTKRAKIVMVDLAIRQVVQEPSTKTVDLGIRQVVEELNPKATMKLMVHRANIDDLGEKMTINSGGGQASFGRVEETRILEVKRKIQSSESKEVGQITGRQSRRTEVSSVVIDNYLTPSQSRSSVTESVDSNTVAGSVQCPSDTSRYLDETARRQIHDLTANIIARNSWSAHLYDKGIGSASKVPHQTSVDAQRPLGAVTPSVDFQMKWDTSAVKEQLLSSVRPQKPRADELETVPKLVMSKEANSQPRSKRLLETPQSDELETVPWLVTDKEANSRPNTKGSFEERTVFANSVATPLTIPNIDKPVFDRDAVEFGENLHLHASRKTVYTEEETGSVSRRYSAVPFNTPVQALRGNGASLRRSVDRMLPTADRVNVTRGRSVEPGMIGRESVHRGPKFNGQLATKELPQVVEVRGGRCGRACWRLSRIFGALACAVGAVCFVYLALSAGYLGDFF